MNFKQIKRKIKNVLKPSYYKLNEINKKLDSLLFAKPESQRIDREYLQKNKFFLIRKFKIDDRKLIFPKNKKLFFLHIPKTGGSTFISSFLGLYADCDHGIKVTESGQNCLFNMKKDEIDSFDGTSFFHGHFPYGAHKHAGLCDDEVSYFTLVRDPVTHMLSMYNWLYQRLVISSEIEFDHFLRCTNNIQTKILAGFTTFNEKENHAHYCFFNDAEIGQEVYDRAIANIEKHFALVGTTEMLEDFMKIFITKMDWCDIVSHLVNEGKVKLLQQLTAEQILEIEKINHWDAKLHNYVTKKFQKINDILKEINRESLTKIDTADWENDWSENRDIIVAGNASEDEKIIPTKIKFGALRHYYSAFITNRIVRK